jgi:hypothetical protein
VLSFRMCCYLIYYFIREGSISRDLCEVQNVIYSTFHELYRHTPERQVVEGLVISSNANIPVGMNETFFSSEA